MNCSARWLNSWIGAKRLGLLCGRYYRDRQRGERGLVEGPRSVIHPYICIQNCDLTHCMDSSVNGREALFPSSYVEKMESAPVPQQRAIPPVSNKPAYRPFMAAHHGADAPPASGDGVNSLGLQQAPGQVERQNTTNKYTSTVCIIDRRTFQPWLINMIHASLQLRQWVVLGSVLVSATLLWSQRRSGSCYSQVPLSVAVLSELSSSRQTRQLFLYGHAQIRLNWLFILLSLSVHLPMI